MFRATAGRAVLRSQLHGGVFGAGGVRGERAGGGGGGGAGGSLIAAAVVGRRTLFRSSTALKQRHVPGPRGFRSWVLRWALAVGGMYYYMTSNVFAGHSNGIPTPTPPILFTFLSVARRINKRAKVRV